MIHQILTKISGWLVRYLDKRPKCKCVKENCNHRKPLECEYMVGWVEEYHPNGL